jgi:hypothetical protein
MQTTIQKLKEYFWLSIKVVCTFSTHELAAIVLPRPIICCGYSGCAYLQGGVKGSQHEADHSPPSIHLHGVIRKHRKI